MRENFESQKPYHRGSFQVSVFCTEKMPLIRFLALSTALLGSTQAHATDNHCDHFMNTTALRRELGLNSGDAFFLPSTRSTGTADSRFHIEFDDEGISKRHVDPDLRYDAFHLGASFDGNAHFYSFISKVDDVSPPPAPAIREIGDYLETPSPPRSFILKFYESAELGAGFFEQSEYLRDTILTGFLKRDFRIQWPELARQDFTAFTYDRIHGQTLEDVLKNPNLPLPLKTALVLRYQELIQTLESFLRQNKFPQMTFLDKMRDDLGEVSDFEDLREKRTKQPDSSHTHLIRYPFEVDDTKSPPSRANPDPHEGVPSMLPGLELIEWTPWDAHPKRLYLIDPSRIWVDAKTLEFFQFELI